MRKTKEVTAKDLNDSFDRLADTAIRIKHERDVLYEALQLVHDDANVGMLGNEVQDSLTTALAQARGEKQP